GSRDLASEFEEQAVQILVLLRRRFAAVHGARSHVIDELMMLVGKPVLLTLAVERDLAPLERTIRIAKCSDAVLLALRRLHPLAVTFGARILDRGMDFLLGILGESAAAIFDVIGESEKALLIGLQHARERAHGGPSLAFVVRLHLANNIADLGAVTVIARSGELLR